MGHRRSSARAPRPHSDDKIIDWAHCPLDQVETLEKTVRLPPMSVPSGERSDVLFTVRTVDIPRWAFHGGPERSEVCGPAKR